MPTDHKKSKDDLSMVLAIKILKDIARKFKVLEVIQIVQKSREISS